MPCWRWGRRRLWPTPWKKWKDMVSLASALVVNIGTLSRPWIEAMKLAIATGPAAANSHRARPGGSRSHPPTHPVPLGELLELGTPMLVRGNASEICRPGK